MKEIVAAVDRRVKERLIGATVLVALLVIVVPELLPQARPPRPAPSERTQGDPLEISIDTATSRATPAVQPQTPAAPASAVTSAHETPEQTVVTPGASAGREPPSAAAPAPPSAAAPVDSRPRAPISAPTASAAGARGSWAVQVGSFANRANAEKLLHALKTSGSPAYVSASGSGSRARYRVRVGPFADRGAAERTLARLKAAGHAGTLLPPGGAG